VFKVCWKKKKKKKELQDNLENISNALGAITDPDKLVEIQKLAYSYIAENLPNEKLMIVAHIDEVF
jgi:hypothetical protein